LRQQATGSGVPLQTSLKYEDLPPGTDPRVEIATLKKALENKEQKVESLQVQVRSFEAVIKHSKEQSKQVVKLKKELTALKVRFVCIQVDEIPQILCMSARVMLSHSIAEGEGVIKKWKDEDTPRRKKGGSNWS